MENINKKEDTPSIKVKKTNFELIGELADFLSTLEPTCHLYILALEYGLILLGELVGQLHMEKSSLDKKGEIYNIKGLGFTCKEVVEPTRNALADHFHRLLIKDYEETIIPALRIRDFKLLARLKEAKKYEGRSECIYLHKSRPLKEKFENRTIAAIDRFSFIKVYLETIQSLFTADKSIPERITQFASSMLLVATGTCARELINALPNKNFDSKNEIINFLKIFKLIRDTLAHPYAEAKTTEEAFKLSITSLKLSLNI